jgi:sialate O-acetylesterase
MKSDPKIMWPGGQACAVSLTYDDALPVHYNTVAPLLSANGLTATFYVCAHRHFTENIAAWKQVASSGHELGNHTLFHPCRRAPEKDYGWLMPDYDLCDYSAQRWVDEMRVANCLLNQIDDQADRTFGNTCCHTSIGRGEHEVELSRLIEGMFVAGRGPLNEKIVCSDSPSFAAVGHFSGDGKSFQELQQDIERAISMGGWIVFMFHGVGEGTHDLFIDTAEHARLVGYLEAHSNQIWTAPMVEVAKHLRSAQQ